MIIKSILNPSWSNFSLSKRATILLSDPIRYFGLFPEPAEYRVWQRCLLDIPFPEIVRSPNQALHLVYTDGSCLFPRWEHLRVASYSAIFAKPDGSFEIIAQGLLPSGSHTAYRAEIFGMSVAFGSYTRVEVALDCKGVVDTATYLMEQLKAGKPVSLPRDNTDLWAYFLQSLQGCSIDECKVRWVKGHQSWHSGSPQQKADAWFNHWADKVAGVPAHWLSRNNPLYRRLIQAHRTLRSLASQVFRYQAAIAMAYAGSLVPVAQGPIQAVPEFLGFGEPSHPGTIEFEHCHVYHMGFARKLLRWLSQLSWFPRSQCGTRVDTSWLELFWGFLFDTSLLTPVFHGGEWKTVDDDEAVYFILPSARSLFNVWKRHVDALCRGGLSVPWLSRLASVSSVALLGAKFRCAGIGGFVPVPKSALCDLSLQFHSASSLRDLRIPYVN